MHEHPLWTEALDLRVIETGGRYSALCDLADDLGLTLLQVQQRWHQLRVTA
ncbi:hypothetical protein [Sediminimonas qiaohouensis]|uniref:hypothetical protein n=1 Tax=Sediminimonas qiaohouensis TaxID=552061 RepID=UPI00040FC113|nr:hypothetical protein [Sediminimonas qiaohouensis]